MSFVPVLRGHAVVTAAICVALTSPAWAAEADRKEGATSAASPAVQPTVPLLVWVDGQAETSFDKASLQESLSRELGREVTLTDDATAAAVRVHLMDGPHADVHYTTPGGKILSRTVDLPPERRRAAQVVSWLTVNLVRDEATELLDELRARRKEEAEARAAEQAALDQAVADKAAADKIAADKAAADKIAADKAAADKAAEAAKPMPPRDDLLRDRLLRIDAALATPISFLRDSSNRELYLQLALGYGESGAINGVAVSPGALRIRRDLLGVATGVGAVWVGGKARGAIVSVGYAQLDGNLDGALVGAGAAVQRGARARGAVVSVGGALAGNLTGALLGGGFATSKSLHGVGISVGATVVRGPSDGLLLSAGANWSAEHRGVEVSSGVNIARDLSGVALAPINVHRRVKGIQIGIINVAEEVDAAIGIISVSKNGRVQPLLWSALDGSAHLAIKSVAGYVFTQIGAGVELTSEKVSYDGGIGMHLRLGKGFFLEPGVHYAALLGTADTADTPETAGAPNIPGTPNEQQLLYVAQLGWRAGDKLDLLAGAGVRHTIVGGSGAPFGPELRFGIAFF